MGKRVTDLNPITDITYDDLLHIVDVSDTSQSPDGSSFKVSVGNFLRSLGVGITIQGYENYTVKKAVGNTSFTQLEVGDLVEGVGAYFGGDYIVATVATSPVSSDANFNTPIYRNPSS